MALVQKLTRSEQTRASDASEKRFEERRNSQASPGDQDADAVLRIRYNPDWSQNTVGNPTALATVEVDATNIILRVDGVIERNVAWAGLSARQLVDAVNAPNADGSRYWRAGLADALDVQVNALAVMAPQNAMVGYIGDSVPIHHSSGLFVYVSPGFDESERGQGDFNPQPFDMDYEYAIQTSPGVPASAVGRGGGIDARQGEDILPQKASRFGTANIRKAKEVHPANTIQETIVRSISHSLTTAGTENILFTIYEDGDPNPIWQTEVPEATLEVLVPDVRTRGPARLNVNAKAFGAFTAGIVVMRGITRAA